MNKSKKNSNTKPSNYFLVGCSNCSFEFIIGDDARSTKKVQCPRCGTQRKREKYRHLAESDSANRIREQRARRLAQQAGYAEQYSNTPTYRQADNQTRTVPPFRRLSSAHRVSDENQTGEVEVNKKRSADVEFAQTRQLLRGDDSVSPGVRVHSVGESLPGKARSIRVGPQSSEWSPQVVETMLPITARIVRDLWDEYDASESFSRFESWIESHNFSANSQFAAHAFHAHLSRYSRAGAGLASISQAEKESLVESLVSLGTGRGHWNAPKEALAIFAELHALGPTYTLLFEFESQEWLTRLKDDPGTVQRSLDVIELLSSSFEIRLSMAPRVRSQLEARFGDWWERVLTEPEDRCSPHHSVGGRDATPTKAFEILSDFGTKNGHLQILNIIADGSTWTYSSLREHPAHDYPIDTLRKYVPELADAGLVSVDDRTRTHKFEITELGELAAGLYLADNDTILAPWQLQLTEISTSTTSTVCGADQEWEGFEDALAEKPSYSGGSALPSDESSQEFVHWLQVGDWRKVTTHRRYTAISEVYDTPGVSLISHPNLPAFEDGKNTFMSHLDNHVLVVAQYGKSLPTLARICQTLLDPRLLASALSVEDVGEEFEDLLDGGLTAADRFDLITRAAQIGTFSEDELKHYQDWHERWSSIPPRLLSRLGDLSGLSGDALQDRREDLYKDFHGAIASATTLYRLAGKDITIQLRFPDVDGILTDESLTTDVRQFFRYTVPKNALIDDLYSWQRANVEKREDKLRERIPVENTDGPNSDLTATSSVEWQVLGDKAHKMTPLIEGALSSINDDVREQVLSGAESQPSLDIPIRRATHETTIKRVIRHILEQKGMSHPRGQNTEHLLRRYTQIYQAILGTEKHGGSPVDVATSLLLLTADTDGKEQFTVSDIASGLGRLPSNQLLPESPNPTEQQVLKTLLASDKPLSRDELKTKAGVSDGSLSHISLLSGIDLIEQLPNGDWRATVEPWWVDASGRDSPYEREQSPVESYSTCQGVIDSALSRTGELAELSTQEYLTLYEKSLWNILDQLGWTRIFPILKHYCYDFPNGPPDAQTDHISIGNSEPRRSDSQTKLSAIHP
jgi:hypothetical protein